MFYIVCVSLSLASVFAGLVYRAAKTPCGDEQDVTSLHLFASGGAFPLAIMLASFVREQHMVFCFVLVYWAVTASLGTIAHSFFPRFDRGAVQAKRLLDDYRFHLSLERD